MLNRFVEPKTVRLRWWLSPVESLASVETNWSTTVLRSAVSATVSFRADRTCIVSDEDPERVTLMSRSANVRRTARRRVSERVVSGACGGGRSSGSRKLVASRGALVAPESSAGGLCSRAAWPGSASAVMGGSNSSALTPETVGARSATTLTSPVKVSLASGGSWSGDSRWVATVMPCWSTSRISTPTTVGESPPVAESDFPRVDTPALRIRVAVGDVLAPLGSNPSDLDRLRP